jgi:hypothetical protein
LFYLLRGAGEAAQEMAEAVGAFANEHGFPNWSANATIYRGGALAIQGQATEGITHMREGLEAVLATGTEVLRPFVLALMTQAYGRAGWGASAILCFLASSI